MCNISTKRIIKAPFALITTSKWCDMDTIRHDTATVMLQHLFLYCSFSFNSIFHEYVWVQHSFATVVLVLQSHSVFYPSKINNNKSLKSNETQGGNLRSGSKTCSRLSAGMKLILTKVWTTSKCQWHHGVRRHRRHCSSPCVPSRLSLPLNGRDVRRRRRRRSCLPEKTRLWSNSWQGWRDVRYTKLITTLPTVQSYLFLLKGDLLVFLEQVRIGPLVIQNIFCTK